MPRTFCHLLGGVAGGGVEVTSPKTLAKVVLPLRRPSPEVAEVMEPFRLKVESSLGRNMTVGDVLAFSTSDPTSDARGRSMSDVRFRRTYCQLVLTDPRRRVGAEGEPRSEGGGDAEPARTGRSRSLDEDVRFNVEGWVWVVEDGWDGRERSLPLPLGCWCWYGFWRSEEDVGRAEGPAPSVVELYWVCEPPSSDDVR